MLGALTQWSFLATDDKKRARLDLPSHTSQPPDQATHKQSNSVTQQSHMSGKETYPLSVLKLQQRSDILVTSFLKQLTIVVT